MIKGSSLDNEWININGYYVEKLNCNLIVEVYLEKRKNNKKLVTLIDKLTIESVHMIIKGLILIT